MKKNSQNASSGSKNTKTNKGGIKRSYEITGTVRIIEDGKESPHMFVIINGDIKDDQKNNIFFNREQNRKQTEEKGSFTLKNPLRNACILPDDTEFRVDPILHNIMRMIAIEEKKVKLTIDESKDKVFRVEI